MAATLVDNVRINVTSMGAGALALGSAVDGYRGIEALQNGKTYNYKVVAGAQWEVGQGQYLSSGAQLVRTPLYSSNGDGLVDLAQNAQVSFVALSSDFNGTGLSADAIEARDQAVAAAALAEDAAEAANAIVGPVFAIPTDGGAAVVGTADGGTVQGFINKFLSSVGSSIVGFIQAGTGAVSRWVQDKLRETVSVKDFGAVGDGTTDDAAAINAFLAAVAGGAHGFVPKGTYKFTSALTCAAASDIEISGRGQFVYAGASTTIDLLTIGSTGTQSLRLRLQGLRMTSTTTMTAGTALKLNKVFRSTLRDIILDGQDGTGNFWNGLWFNGCDVETLDGFQLTAANDALRINDGSDIFLDNGKIAPADNPTVGGRGVACGFRVGGGFGGTQIGAVDIIGCGNNMIVDNTLSATANREITFSSIAALDSSAIGSNLYLNETSGAPVYVASNGWFASAKTHNIEIASSTSAYHIILVGGRVYNALTGDGIRNNAVNSTIQCTGVEILNNAGYGVNNPAGAVNVTTMGCTISDNGLGENSGVVMDPVRTLVASVANGANVAVPGISGMATIALADGGAYSGVYVFGGGGATLLGASNAIFVASTTTPAAGKVSFAYSGSGNIYKIYNNSGSAIRMQVAVTRTL